MQKTLFLLLVVLCFCTCAFSSPDLQPSWEEFKSTYNKRYGSVEEETFRLSIFKENLLRIAELQSYTLDTTYGINQFTDLTPEEFKATYLMPQQRFNLPNITSSSFSSSQQKRKNLALPATWDWSTKGVVGPIENEGQCGATWAISAKETFESVCAIAGYPLYDLSAQQLLDCDTSDYGCNGGFPYSASNYIIKNGLETNADYPYVAQQGTCQYDKKDVVPCTMVSWEYIAQNGNETVIQEFVYEHSPISACIDAMTWQYYTGGVITKSSNCGKQIDHCIELVGWTVVNGISAWILRNQWGATWGVNGYVYVEIGYDVCGITSYPLAVCVKDKTGSKVVC